MKKYKIIIHRDRCLGCGTCEQLFPKFFKVSNEDGLVDVKKFKKEKDKLIGEISEFDLENFERVSQSCPSEVIEIKK